MTQVVRQRGASGKGILMKKYEDIIFPNMESLDPERGMKYVETFTFRRSDIIQCSFPKCGTHWMVNILKKLRSLDVSDRPMDTLIEYAQREAYESQSDPRLIETHLRPRRLRLANIDNKVKVILMLRNLKDVAVSYYNHQNNAKVVDSKQTWDEFFQYFIQGEIIFGSYFSYLREWEDVLKEIRDGKLNIALQLFYYEDLVFNPKEQIERLNKFLEFNREDGHLDTVLKETTLEALRNQYLQSRDMAHPTCIDKEGKSLIFRKGLVGDWKNHLTVAQSETIDKLLQETLRHELIKFKFEL